MLLIEICATDGIHKVGLAAVHGRCYLVWVHGFHVELDAGNAVIETPKIPVSNVNLIDGSWVATVGSLSWAQLGRVLIKPHLTCRIDAVFKRVCGWSY